MICSSNSNISQSKKMSGDHSIGLHQKRLHELCRVCGGRAQTKTEQRGKKKPNYTLILLVFSMIF